VLLSDRDLRAAARPPRSEGTVHVSATATFFSMLDDRDRPPPVIAPRPD